ncbi:thioredoxin [Aspergillus bombycis]|uniref:Thioredoxin n=1 Tax=Aspergillus bombycis TaxID=109264 RepID=A0A1F8A7H9_9EURO|nr:thioredoxin [Aspergillus bombycis]OGM47692.1 thioredoxin [Aspergillus bombycis]
MSTLIEIPSEAEFTSYITSLPPTTLSILYFHAPWAAPCAQMRAVLSALASQYPATTPPTTAFISIDAEELPDISEDYDVTAVPFVVLTRNGEVLESISGSEATRVRDAVERHAGSKASAGAPATIPPTADRSAPRDRSRDGYPAAGWRCERGWAYAGAVEGGAGTPSAPQCGFSRQLVGILRERSVKYGFFNILADEDVRQGLKEFADWPTFPQLWVSGELVGGLDIVKEELDNDPDFLRDFSVNKAPAAA